MRLNQKTTKLTIISYNRVHDDCDSLNIIYCKSSAYNLHLVQYDLKSSTELQTSSRTSDPGSKQKVDSAELPNFKNLQPNRRALTGEKVKEEAFLFERQNNFYKMELCQNQLILKDDILLAGFPCL